MLNRGKIEKNPVLFLFFNYKCRCCFHNVKYFHAISSHVSVTDGCVTDKTNNLIVSNHRFPFLPWLILAAGGVTLTCTNILKK